MTQGSVCIVCGCNLAEGDTRCPICGTEAVPVAPTASANPANQTASSTSEVQSSPAPSQNLGETPEEAVARRKKETKKLGKRKPSKRKASSTFVPTVSVGGFEIPRKALIISGAVAAVIVVVVAALIVRGIMLDRHLQQQVDEASKSKNESPAAASVKGLAVGNVAAGGIVAKTDGGVYLAGANGVYLLNDKAVDDALDRKCSEGAFNVCFDDSTLYYLKPGKTWGAPFGGSAIEYISNVGEEGQKTPQELHGDGLYRCLSCYEGHLYYLEYDGRTFWAQCEPTGGSESGVKQIAESSADNAWLFVEKGIVYFVTTGDGEWKVRRFEAPDGSFGSGVEVAHGSGELAAAAIHDGELFYSLVADGSSLQRNDLKNSVSEFSGVKDVTVIAAAGDSIAVLTKRGELAWIDSASGVVHDLTGELERVMPEASPLRMAMGVSGSWIYLSDDKGNLVRIGTKGASGEVLAGY